MSEEEFKNGDLVRCVDAKGTNGSLEEGKVYEVDYYDGDGVGFTNACGFYSPDRFALVRRESSFAAVEVTPKPLEAQLESLRIQLSDANARAEKAESSRRSAEVLRDALMLELRVVKNTYQDVVDSLTEKLARQ